MRQLHRLDAWIEGYLAYLLEVRRKTKRTVSDVRCTLKRASEACARTHPDRSLWELELEDFLRWLERERAEGRTAACRAKYVSHLRGFLDYTWRSGRSDRNVLDGLSLRGEVRRVPRVLTLEEAERLVEACSQESAASRRDRVIVLLLYGCEHQRSDMGSDRSMRQSYLVVYDYGQGGIWAFVEADSEDQITTAYPELKVVGQRPDWMSDEEEASIMQTDSYDLADAPKGLLADILAGRK